MALKVVDSNLTTAAKTFTLSMLESSSSMNLRDQFTGQALSYIYSAKSEDFNTSIIFKEKLVRDDKFSKLIKCSREGTQILDI